MKNYGNFPSQYTKKETAQIVILPIPYETLTKGAEKGPQAILDASHNLEYYDIETRTEVFLQGIYTASPISEDDSPDEMVDATYKVVKQLLNKGKFVASIGGEHSITNGPVLAYAERFQNLTVLQLDAHTDLKQYCDGSKYNHSCIMARIKEICPIVQVGMRRMSIEEVSELSPERAFWASEIHKDAQWMEKALNKLTENVYITIDLDVFDPSIMTSTRTPEPGGLSWYQVVDFLKLVNQHTNIVGFDIVGLCPNENEKSPDFLAAKLIYQLLSFIFAKKK